MKKVTFSFEHNQIENPRSFNLKARLVNPTTQKQNFYGYLENSNNANGGVIDAGRYELYTNLNSEEYFNELKDGNIKIGLQRTGSNEVLEITEIIAQFCGFVVNDSDNGDSVSVDAAANNIRSSQGVAAIHSVDANITYRLQVSGAARDGNGASLPSVSINYLDPRKNLNETRQLASDNEYFIHTDGKVSLFYASGGENNTGGHKVSFSRENLD